MLQEASASNYYYSNTQRHYTSIQRSLQLFLFKSCQCSLPYSFEVNDDDFRCAEGGYVIYRARLTSDHRSTPDLASLTNNITGILIGEERNRQITVSGRKYLVEPGPCGVTVPDLYAPHCFNDTLDREETTTQPTNSIPPTANSTTASEQPIAPSSTTPHGTFTTESTDNGNQPVVAQDNTAITVTLASICGAILMLVLVGCILVLLFIVKIRKR